MKTYWQIAAGNATQSRDYSAVLLKYGIAAVGGDDHVAQLVVEVAEGDVVILKEGLQKILAAGLVCARNGSIGGVDDKSWVRDIEGWDLRAYRYVKWHVPPAPIQTSGLARSTINRSHDEEHRRIADQILSGPSVEPEPEPPEPTVIPTLELVSSLKEFGNVDEDALLRHLAYISECYGDHQVWEQQWDADTVRDRLVRPLLVALGWKQHQMSTDVVGRGLGHLICAFPQDKKPTAENVLVVECRPWYHGVALSADQALAVASRFPSTLALAVTNGVAIKLYSRDPIARMFKTQPAAYCNLKNLTERCSFDPSLLGARVVFRWLVCKS